MYKIKFRQNVAALVRYKDQYLACCRKDYNTWQTIQGGIELFDASPADALVREMEEELGVKSIDFKIIYQSKLWRRYLFSYKSARERHRENAGQDQLWFLIELKDKDVFDFEVVKNEFSHLEWVSLTELINRYALWKKLGVYDFCREIEPKFEFVKFY